MTPAATAVRSATGMGLAAVALLALALRAPIPLTVLGLAIFGLAHVLLELRYVIGRFATTIGFRLAISLVLLLTGIAVSRLLAPYAPRPTLLVEITVGWALIAAAALLVMHPPARAITLVVAALGLAASLRWPAYYVFAITHLHNLVPLAFLWDWSRRVAAAAPRRVFWAVQLGWALVLPAVVLTGVLDPLVRIDASAVGALVGDGAGTIRASAPPHASAVVAARCLVVFAFLQSMHYVTWIGFFPTAGGEANRRVDRVLGVLRGWGKWVLLAVATAAILSVFLTRYPVGKSIYSVVASYHVYLEFPMLLLGAVALHRRVAG